MRKKIYYHDTDCGGVVYYANYLKYLEEARTEFFAKKGISIKDMIRKGSFFVVGRTEIDYKAPAHYGDILEISAKIAEISKLKLVFDHEIKNQEGRLIVQAKTILVHVNKDLRPAPIPKELRKKIESR